MQGYLTTLSFLHKQWVVFAIAQRQISLRSAARQPKSNQLPAVHAIKAFVYSAYAYLEKDA
jgi:hypothetical protein